MIRNLSYSYLLNMFLSEELVLIPLYLQLLDFYYFNLMHFSREGCTTYGPRANFGLRSLYGWPANVVNKIRLI